MGGCVPRPLSPLRRRRQGRHVLASLAQPQMSLLGVPAVASACRRPMRVCNRSAGYPLRSAPWNWWSAAAGPVLTPSQVALPAVRNHVSGCSNYVVDQVELSGLEPLTSCMPCRPISSGGIPGSLVPVGQATCSVRLVLVLAARVWVRSHLICHWLSGSHQGGETPWPGAKVDSVHLRVARHGRGGDAGVT
jgi:hypothetical protein